MAALGGLEGLARRILRIGGDRPGNDLTKLDQLLQLLVELFGADAAMLTYDDGKDVHLARSQGPDAEAWPLGRVGPASCGYCVLTRDREGQSVFVPDTRRRGDQDRQVSPAIREAVRSYGGVRLTMDTLEFTLGFRSRLPSPGLLSREEDEAFRLLALAVRSALAQILLRLTQEAQVSARRTCSDFAALISHELFTPLHQLCGLAGLIRDGLSAHPAQDAAEIEQAGAHLTGALRDILGLAMLDAGTHAFRRTPFDPAALVRRVGAVAPQWAGVVPVCFEIDAPAGLPLALGDEKALIKALCALLHNAFRYIESGTVRLSVGQEGGALVFAVSDTGPGMTAAAQAQALQPFSVVEAVLTKRYSGLGLGLPTAVRLVEGQGGAFTMESGPGEGTTVRLRLPAA